MEGTTVDVGRRILDDLRVLRVHLLTTQGPGHQHSIRLPYEQYICLLDWICENGPGLIPDPQPPNMGLGLMILGFEVWPDESVDDITVSEITPGGYIHERFQMEGLRFHADAQWPTDPGRIAVEPWGRVVKLTREMMRLVERVLTRERAPNDGYYDPDMPGMTLDEISAWVKKEEEWQSENL